MAITNEALQRDKYKELFEPTNRRFKFWTTIEGMNQFDRAMKEELKRINNESKDNIKKYI